MRRSPGKRLDDVSWRMSWGRFLEDVFRTSRRRRLEDVSWKTSWRRLKKSSSRLPFQTNLGRIWGQNWDVFTTSLQRLCVGWVAWFSLLLEILGNMCIVIIFVKSVTSWILKLTLTFLSSHFLLNQKFRTKRCKYLKNEKNFWHEIKHF